VRAAIAAALALAVSAAAAGAQVPVVNARVERRAAAQGVAREVQAVVDRGTAAWIGYSVPLLRRTNAGLRAEWCCGRCRLEPPTDLVVLARVDSGTLVELRSLSVDCDVDAGGMPLVWLDGVTPEQSVSWLSSLIPAATTASSSRDRVPRAALAALSGHASPAAATPLVQLARTSPVAQMRSRAIALLAQRPASEVLPAISEAIDQDADRQVRRQAVAALGRLGGGGGVPRLLELARTHKDSEVRRQAMLALGESRDPRAVEFFAQVLR
jgi:hypothetical protein